MYIHIVKHFGFASNPKLKYSGFAEAKQIKKYNWGGAMLTDPYVIKITNSGGAPEGSVVILDSTNALKYAGAGDSYGNSPNIHLSAGVPNVKYEQILYEIMQQPFISSMIQLSGATSGIQQPISVTYQSASGKQETKSISPVLDPYQSQSTTVQNQQQFKVDGFTKITLSMVSPGDTLLYIYPLEAKNFTRSFTGGNQERKYIVKMLKSNKAELHLI